MTIICTSTNPRFSSRSLLVGNGAAFALESSHSILRLFRPVSSMHWCRGEKRHCMSMYHSFRRIKDILFLGLAFPSECHEKSLFRFLSLLLALSSQMSRVLEILHSSTTLAFPCEPWQIKPLISSPKPYPRRPDRIYI